MSRFSVNINSDNTRYLDFHSHHEKKHKISTASTLLSRASNLPSTSAGKSKELIYVSNALESNGYPPSFISNILKKKPPPETTPSPEELVGMFFKWADPSNSDSGFAVLPYIKGLTEPLSRLLRNNGIRTTSRPLKTLQQEFVSPKSRPPVDQQTIKCCLQDSVCRLSVELYWRDWKVLKNKSEGTY